MTLQNDLSEHHRPVSDLFPAITEDDQGRYRLSREQVEFFHEYGYLSDIPLVEESQVARLLSELEEIRDPRHPGNKLFYEFHTNESADPNAVLFHSLGHWRITRGFHDVLWSAPFVVAASQLLGDRAVRFWHDQLFCKPALHGGVVAWHQDYSYWTRTTPMQHLTCWIGLDDTTRDNGCLYYIPGSHKWGLMNKPVLAGDMAGLLQHLAADQRKQFENKVPVEMKKGRGTFHHPLMVHGSYENRSASPRRAFVLNVFADGTISDSNDEILKGVPVIRKGKKMDGRFFPLLFDPLRDVNRDPR